MDEFTYATVCSGIGAPETAWSPLGWRSVFASEIERFPSRVLEHHYPDVPNYGDLNNYKEWPDHEQLGLICGGTPCQSFSVAGLRKGMDDPRGNLALVYLGLIARYNPRWVLWENVPGVLSSNGGRDFGAFLGALGKLGYGYAYRVLDAQYFGVPQRRRRVFVVAYLGDWRPPYAVLFESDSMRGYPPPSRGSGQSSAKVFEVGPGGGSECEVIPTLDSRCKDGPIRNQVGPLVMAHGQGNAEIVKDGTPALTCNHEAPIIFEDVRRDGVRIQKDISLTLQAFGGTGGGNTPMVCHSIDARTAPVIGKDMALPLDTDPHTQAIVLNNDRGAYMTQNGKIYSEDDKAFSLNTIDKQVVAFVQNSRDEVRVMGGDGEIAGALAAEPGSKQQTYVTYQDAIVRRLTPRECERLQGFPDDYTLIPSYGNSTKYYDEVLQYLLASGYSKEVAETLARHPDAPRYKALGNSMAVPVVNWIGRRIKMYEELKAEGLI